MMSMKEILSHYPETAAVFLHYRMSCVGCYLSSFDTLEEALFVHGLPVDKIMERLNEHLEILKKIEREHDDE